MGGSGRAGGGISARALPVRLNQPVRLAPLASCIKMLNLKTYNMIELESQASMGHGYTLEYARSL